MLRASATSKFPLLVSKTVAVVSTLVCPRMLPPTIIEAPTSEITPPNPAIAAARIDNLASRARIHSICHREAPSARICSRTLGFSCWTAASVSPVTMGNAISVWAMIMASGLYIIPRKPRGPLRHSRIATIRPTTTGGIPMPTFTRLMRKRRPPNRLNARAIPVGTPMIKLVAVAIKDTRKDSRTMAKTSGSPPRSKRIASLIPCHNRSILHLWFYFFSR